MAKETNSGHSFEAFYKRATSPLVVLRLLSEKPMYGYEITLEMKQRSGGKYTMSLLYPVLYRLLDQGYVCEDHTEVAVGRARTYYAITPEGLEYYKRTVQDYRRISGVFEQLLEGGPGDD